MATPIPRNDAAFTLSEIALATGGAARGEAETSVRGVVTDSRADVSGSLFVALPGERFDGHDFVPDVVRRGAAAVLVERDVALPPEVPKVTVASTTDALGALGRLHRRRWGGRIVAVAGSAGKTTTKSAIFALCRALFADRAYAAPGNLNNKIGVPMVLLGLGPEHRLAVVEVGTNQAGEVAALSRICEPDVAVLTLIGLEHSEGLGDLDAIEAEEGAVFSALRTGGAAIANGDDIRARRRLLASSASTKVVYGTEPAADYRVVERRSRDTGGSTLLVERSAGRGGGRMTIETSLLGLAGALSSVAALATAEVLAAVALEPALVSRALGERSVGESGRLVPIELEGRVLVLDDSYNSNPPSLRSSLAAARELATERGSRLLLVVGEMRELGALSEACHRELGDEMAKSGAAALVAVAGDASLFVEPARARGMDAEFVHDADAALERVLGLVRTGDVVLVKASRGVRAERVVEGLVRARGKAA
jgi:UDP-N-acetylmuramoyl-tripeptide--D-alanyl-D-alanine ligase